MKWHQPSNGAFTCRCGKCTYPKRKAARRACRKLFPAEHMQVYRCWTGSGFHFGHPRGDERLHVERDRDVA